MFIPIAIVLIIFASTSSAESGFGPCQNATALSEFDLQQYLGLWYEIAKFQFYFEDGGVCITADYSLKDNGHVKVNNSQRMNTTNGKLESSIGDAYVADPSKPAEISVSFGSPFYAPYWVLNTDYENFSYVFSCTSIGDAYHFEWAWILSRTPTLEQSYFKQGIATFASFGIPVEDFTMTQQEGCW